MAEAIIKTKNGVVKWIVGLCLTATLAIVGWTITFTLAARMKAFDEVKIDVTEIEARQDALSIRTAVLENKYDTIQAALAEIKALLQKHIEK